LISLEAAETRPHGKIEKTVCGFSVKQIWPVLVFILAFWILTFGSYFTLPAWAKAGSLQARMAQFPDWRSPPSLSAARGELYYPNWLAGKWTVTSILTHAGALLAPEIVTPGFESNRAQIGKAIAFSVQFKPASAIAARPAWLSPFPVAQPKEGTVADRVYNSTRLTEALMGKDVLESIQVDLRALNRQVAQFRNGQQLVTEISGRAVETNKVNEFISSELYQQKFSGPAQIYFNQVENTVKYRLVSAEPPQIEVEQMTAVYLSPQDPDYFKAWQQPVALYCYRMNFTPLNPD
jgi:hypothetical protein